MYNRKLQQEKLIISISATMLDEHNKSLLSSYKDDARSSMLSCDIESCHWTRKKSSEAEAILNRGRPVSLKYAVKTYDDMKIRSSMNNKSKNHIKEL